MTGAALLLTIIVAQPAAPEIKDVVAAWNERASSTESGDVELTIVRDSRHESFGAPDGKGRWPSVRLRFDHERRQLDVSRQTVVRRDGRTQAAESDPDRARVEFRNVLLEEELKGPQMIPLIGPATLIIDGSGAEKGQKVAPLDRLLAEAPLRAAQPLRLTDPSKLTLAGHEQLSSRLKLSEKQSVDREQELWIESRVPYRPVRIIQHEKGRPVWQIDLTWTSEEPRFPTEYFVETINGSGEALEFIEAKLALVETPLPSSTDFGQIGTNRDQPPSPSPSSVRWRSRVRSAFDSNWLPLALVAGGTLVILGRSRRKPAVN